jgi:hypothetical protein
VHGHLLSLDGCAGLQLDFPNTEIPDVFGCWVPFEGVIAVGWR